MGISSRSGGVHVEVTPAVVSPRQTVHATVPTDTPITTVTSATVEWGYTNFYRYHWAGRADSASAELNDSIRMMDQVGTNCGSERDNEDWVGITRVELPVVGGEFRGGTSTFRVPSWAPGSSPLIARWSCRLVIQRGGRDVYARADFDVVIGSADVRPHNAPVERIDGPRDTDIDIVLPSSVFRAGNTISGQLTLTPHADLPDGDVGVYLQQLRTSHPLVRTPAAADVVEGRTLQLDKRIELRAGNPVVLSFALPLPDTAPPSASAVHSSLSWFVAVHMFYADSASHLTERVRRPIVVINAP